MTVQLPYNLLPGADVPGSAAEAQQANNERLASQPEAPRIVRGRVSNAGAIAGGTGFTVSKLATGEYRVTFDEAFPDIPAVVGSPMLGTVNSKTWQHDTETATASAFRCSVRDSTTGTTVDVGFHFIATEA